jgi:hypothetical protein
VNVKVIKWASDTSSKISAVIFGTEVVSLEVTSSISTAEGTDIVADIIDSVDIEVRD